jgi:hypothetical protein
MSTTINQILYGLMTSMGGDQRFIGQERQNDR